MRAIFGAGEGVLPRHANVPAAADGADLRRREREPAADIGGSEDQWSIVGVFEEWRGTYQPKYFGAVSNPAVRDRVNCVNSRLKNRLEEVRILIDPKCKELIRDLEEVAWEVDTTGARTGELNKKDPARTHASDALGYYISEEYSLKPKVGEKGDGPIAGFW